MDEEESTYCNFIYSKFLISSLVSHVNSSCLIKKRTLIVDNKPAMEKIPSFHSLVKVIESSISNSVSCSE